MHKICAIILLATLAIQNEGASQAKWSRPIRSEDSPASEYTRERRQFVFGEWIPLTKPCPTCRPLVDPLDVGQRVESSGLVPPRPPAVTRQIHGGEGNFFPQDESAVLSVPPPPPTFQKHPAASPSGTFQTFSYPGLAPFATSSFQQSIPPPQIFPQAQPIQFLHQPFLPNQNLLVNSNQPILPVLPNSGGAFNAGNRGGQFVRNEKIPNFESNFGQQKFTENVVLEQNVRQLGGNSFSNKPNNFPKQQPVLQQNSPPAFIQQQSGVQQQPLRQPHQIQQHNSVKSDDSILSPPPPALNVTSSNAVIPGLEKEEIQLLYVPVETLRQRGNLQQQYLLQQQQSQSGLRLQKQLQRPQQNIQLQNDINAVTRASTTPAPTKPTLTTIHEPKGHFVTENSIASVPTLSSVKLSSSHPFSTAPTPSTVFFQSLHGQQTPHPFVSATPISTTEPTFVTSSPFTQKLVALTPENMIPHISTISNAIQFTTPGIHFVTTPKTIITEDGLSEEIITGKPHFGGFPTSKFPQNFAFHQQQPVHQQGNVHLQSFGNQQLQSERPLTTSKFLQNYSTEKQTSPLSYSTVTQQPFSTLKQTDRPQFTQQQVRENELREQLSGKENLQSNEFDSSQQIQPENESRHEQNKYAQQKRQKESGEQRFTESLRQKELEHDRLLQQQRQSELDGQKKIQGLREVDDRGRQTLQKQRVYNDRQRQNVFDSEEQKYSQEKAQRQKQDALKKQQFYQQKQQQQILHQVHQVQQQQQQQEQKLTQTTRNPFSDSDNANFISQAEAETDNPQLVPHQPPLSVFYKGHGKGEPRISDVLKELRSSRSITVLDQYFEKMPRVFVGPAGLVPPTGYDKYELPYLSNIENRLLENQREKLPFFVAPLNFIPPTGYSKIPFPSPHVGSVVISSDSASAATAKPYETGVTSSEEYEDDGRGGTLSVVGPELPGLINSLETQSTTVKSTTPSLPQTTAQLRNRRPNTNAYRTRKPVSRGRSTTSTTTTTTSKPETVQQDSEETDSGFFRKPINRFLKRRRQPVKSTTENAIEYQTEKKPAPNKYYSGSFNSQSKKQGAEAGSGGSRKYGNQEIERVTTVTSDKYQPRPTPGSYKPSKGGNLNFSKERGQKQTDESVNTLQSEEEGPYPTGSAKTITQEIYWPNDLRTKDGGRFADEPKPVKLEPKIDSSTLSDNLFDGPQSTRFSEEITPTVQYGKSSEEKSGESISEYSTFRLEGDKKYTPLPTSLKYFDQTEYPKTDSPLPLASAQTYNRPQSVQQTTEYVYSDDRFTSALAEISKHHHIPQSGESSKRLDNNNSKDTTGLSIELQAPFSDIYSREQQLKQYSIAEGQIRPTQGVYYSGEYSSNGLTPRETYSQNIEATTIKRNGFEVTPTASGTVYNENTGKYVETSTDSLNRFSDASAQSTTEYSKFDGPKSTPVAALSSQVFGRRPESNEYSDNGEYGSITEKNRSEENYAEKDGYGTTLPNLSRESTETAVKNFKQSFDESTEEQKPTPGEHDSNTNRQKFSNPSIVRVRTRVRGQQRGQVNYGNGQSGQPISSPPRSRTEIRYKEYTDDEYDGKTESPQGVSKYSFRGVKKINVRPTVETATEHEQKSHVFTVKPHRRPSNPSTVSTKRIRRPTTPLPTEESPDEANTYIPETYSGQPEYSSSGVSNDVYYEQATYSTGKPKYKKPYDSKEYKDGVTTAGETTSLSYSYSEEDYSRSSSRGEEEFSREKGNSAQTGDSQEVSESRSRWTPTENDAYSSILTTVRTTVPEKQAESSDTKKGQESKKAFDPDLEKKSGRRRVRVRVNKKPHENFETAESQNLRTVANVLVPPTSTYKPAEDGGTLLAKNSEANYDGGQKSFGVRSREYFRKRVNSTLSESNVTQHETETDQFDKSTVGERPYPINDGEGESEGVKGSGRTKFRGYVRKVIKHAGGRKIGEQTVAYNDFDGKQSNLENLQQQQQQQQGGLYNQTGRLTGTRHKTFVRYIKKSKAKTQEVESPNREIQSESILTETQREIQRSHNPITESAEVVQGQQIGEESSKTGDVEVNEHSDQDSAKPETSEPEHQREESQPESTEANRAIDSGENQKTGNPEVYTTQGIDLAQNLAESNSVRPIQPSLFGKGATKLYPVPYQASTRETNDFNSVKTTESSLLRITEGSRVTQKNKLFQTLRPVYQRAPNTGIIRIRDQSSTPTTEQSTPEQTTKKSRYNKYKYGKGNSYVSSSINQNGEEKKEDGDQTTGTQFKSKTSFAYDRKYSRTGSKTREGTLGVQFNRNRYSPFRKVESTSVVSDKSNESVQEREETTSSESELDLTTPSSSAETETDNAESFKQTETSSEEEPESISTTGHAITSSEEESSSRDESGETITTERYETTASDSESQNRFGVTITTTEGLPATDDSKETTIGATDSNAQPDLYRFGKNSFSFDETEKFTGTKNRAYVRNITADIIENTSSFSGPGIEHKNEIVVSSGAREGNSDATTTATEQTETDSSAFYDKTDVTSYESVTGETTSEEEEEEEKEKTTDSIPTAAHTFSSSNVNFDTSLGGSSSSSSNSKTNIVVSVSGGEEESTKSKNPKLLKTSTTTKISHETEICFRGKCIRTKSENPDEDLKLLVDSAASESKKSRT